MIDIPVRMTALGLFKSLAFYQNYLNMNLILKELIEEEGLKCPLWLESDIYYLKDKVESYQQR